MNRLFLIFIVLFFSCKNGEKDNVTKTNDTIVEKQDTIKSDKVELGKAPNFKLEDIDGNFKTLESYKGKLILLDIWATWCGPCLANVPYIKELEQMYKGKNFEIVSISIDSQSDKEKWKMMVKEKQLVGEQLFAGAESRFPFDYQVSFIPRFILISPQGDLIDNDAPQVINEMGDGINQEIIQLINQNLK